jgi:hypothetical protein
MNELVLAVLMLGGAMHDVPARETTTLQLGFAPQRTDEGTGLRLPQQQDLIADDLQRARPRRADASSFTSTSSSRTARIIGVAVGAVGGFYAGGMAGYALAQDKDRDDDGVSGLRGVVIGAPIGALIGGLIGYQVAK